MSYISVFDVLGPNMIGPSSSHTAGAAVIAFLAHKMIAPPLKKVDFTLYGSFSKTYHGHGTDRALLGGMMGFSTDDIRIRNSFQIASERGLAYSFTPCRGYPHGKYARSGDDRTRGITWRRQGAHLAHQRRIGRLHRRLQYDYRDPAG